MNIMVFDVPAESGGALSILYDLYNAVETHSDENINWIFIVSKPQLKDKENIKILRYPWVKRSWFHRLFFDNYFASKLIKKYKVDKVLSLQNLIIPKTKVPQTLYVHQSLPFVDYKFSFIQNRTFWIYQNIIGKKIFKSIKKADMVIVQTKWMKNACIAKTNVENEKINVVAPQIKNMDNNVPFEVNHESFSTFFYPAGGGEYKNHEIIIRACKILKDKNMHNFNVVLTLDGNETDHISSLCELIRLNNLPVKFVGRLGREEVFNYYSKSVLLFPSYIETFGLPMLEAKQQEGMILASDCPFSHEILDGYENAYFFDPFDEVELSTLMESTIAQKIKYKIIDNHSLGSSENRTTSTILSLVISQ